MFEIFRQTAKDQKVRMAKQQRANFSGRTRKANTAVSFTSSARKPVKAAAAEPKAVQAKAGTKLNFVRGPFINYVTH